jgi:ribosomal protein S27E
MDEVEIRARCPGCEALNLLVIGTTAPNKVSCCRCGSVLLDYEPVRGYVYVLSNESMPGLVKIGFTARDITKRVTELNSGTAVPAPFVIEGVFSSDDPEAHE